MAVSASDPAFALDFRASEASVRGVLSAVRQRMAESGYDADSCGTVEVVLAEALNNIVEHAFADTGEGQVVLEIHEGGERLHFDLRDTGSPLPGLTLPAVRLPRQDVPVEDLPEGGFGWYLIHSLTSNLDYAREGRENHLSFEIETASGTPD